VHREVLVLAPRARAAADRLLAQRPPAAIVMVEGLADGEVAGRADVATAETAGEEPIRSPSAEPAECREPLDHRRRRRRADRFEIQGAYSDAIQARYERWRARHEPDADELERQRRHAGQLPAQPLVSIVVPVFDPPVGILQATIESALGQTYPKLELCIADAGTDSDCAMLIADFARRDPRLRHVTLQTNRGISANSNAALALATGEFVALLDHDDLLAPEALYRVAELLGESPGLDVIYSDEDRLHEHRHKADEAYRVGQGKRPVDAYLGIDEILDVVAAWMKSA